VNIAGLLKSLNTEKYPWTSSHRNSPEAVRKTLRARPAEPAVQSGARRPQKQKRYVAIAAVDVRNLQTRVRQAQWALFFTGVEANRTLAGKLADWDDYLETVLSE
jgi:hypothetical protein